MYKYEGRITKDFILSQISQEDIFHKYLGIYPELYKKYINPKRKDSDPGCSFYYSGSTLYFVDKPWGKHWDCFNVVQYDYNISFKEALRKIAQDFNIVASEEEYIKINSPTPFLPKAKKIIEIKKRDWNKFDIEYWNWIPFKNGGSKILDWFRVCPVEYAFLDGRISYIYTHSDPCYAYYFLDGDYKLYFPFRKKGQVRFITNTNKIQGLEQLDPIGENLLITKSYKDVIAAFLFKIPAVAPQSESVVLSAEEFSDLYNRFDNIYSLYDFDRTGITTANKLRKLYEIKPFFFTNGRFYTHNYKAKDLTEHINLVGLKETNKLIKSIYGNLSL